ncbi:MAG: HAD family hydrolase [Gemmatimonadetes bacterium]|uniref:phosphoglycolate phosphatase n=1 Tax=Candidatus Kutchimonas denitrificans TaxID=3056748 RepID=A0AAE5CAJ7_9BACT|nr:HAD family hydrolase [Gemmatimonadota bacterium]NIR76576.1 HAD family hydrolase [Candidatus Kutchimonas denitrificans]NIS01132.1 HAD family hydrolase [Gemmatimonadota bacterium]NIT66899.1 HAD family hydrolase [Gemmatimonadota bacterium]NIU54672.1 HAD-IA family hydrolase [Gemmatimonadota bacterium]
MIRCILFDFDGTLVDTWNLYIEAYVRTLEPYVGGRLSLEELKALGPTSERRLLERVPEVADVERAYREFLDHYRSLHPSRFEGVYPGIGEMLAALTEMRLAVGIVTGKTGAALEITLEQADLGEFDVVITDDDVAEAKPAPEGLELALDRLGLAADQAVYVGDSIADAEAARSAGINYAAALWPKHRSEVDGFLERAREPGTWAELERPASLIGKLRTTAG